MAHTKIIHSRSKIIQFVFRFSVENNRRGLTFSQNLIPDKLPPQLMSGVNISGRKVVCGHTSAIKPIYYPVLSESKIIRWLADILCEYKHIRELNNSPQYCTAVYYYLVVIILLYIYNLVHAKRVLNAISSKK